MSFDWDKNAEEAYEKQERISVSGKLTHYENEEETVIPVQRRLYLYPEQEFELVDTGTGMAWQKVNNGISWISGRYIGVTGNNPFWVGGSSSGYGNV